MSCDTPNPPPAYRRLRVYSFDPSFSTRPDEALINEITLTVPWEKDLGRGPVGEYLKVIEDPNSDEASLEQIDLNSNLLALTQNGLDPSESNKQFHQQMVYAVAMTTIDAFEHALGRVALWNSYVVDEATQEFPAVDETGAFKEEFARQLRVYPHGLMKENANYMPRDKAVRFGYFQADPSDAQSQMPGGWVHTCLSHDIIVHETTHALLDGLQPFYFLVRGNPDNPAFHEAFADLVALFQHFAMPEALKHEIARTRGDLATENLLAKLAVQFGQSIGNYKAMRDAIGDEVGPGQWQRRKPDHEPDQSEPDPHKRSSRLVAAMFDDFLTMYRVRTEDLMRIAGQPGSEHFTGELHPDLVNRLADEAGRAATHVLKMTIRALDYCPLADIEFGDFLRGLITSDLDLVPEDPLRYRVAIIDAFRRWHVYPRDVATLSVEALRWKEPSGDFPMHSTDFDLEGLLEKVKERIEWPPSERDWCDWKTGTSIRETAFKHQKENRKTIDDWIKVWIRNCNDTGRGEEVEKLGKHLGLALTKGAPGSIARFGKKPDEFADFEGFPRFRVVCARPARRIFPGGRIEGDLVVQIAQRRKGYFDPVIQDSVDQQDWNDRQPPGDFIFPCGCTVLIDMKRGKVRHIVAKRADDNERLARMRRNLKPSKAEKIKREIGGIVGSPASVGA